MTPSEVAKRLSVPVADVLEVVALPVDKHGDGAHVATVKGGERVLISDTTFRRYVPEVDGQLDDEPADEPVQEAPPRATARKRTPRKTTRGGAK